MNKRGDAGLTAIVIIVIIVVFLGWLVHLGTRECSTNSDCSPDAYCSVDHTCNQIPVIERTPINRDYTKPALIVGGAIILSVLILKIGSFANKWLETREKQPVQTVQHPIQNIQSQFPYRQNALGSAVENTRNIIQGFTKDNYVGIILSALLGISLLLTVHVDYLAVGIVGAIALFAVNYKLWIYTFERNLEGIHIGLLTIIYVFLSLFLTTKGGTFLVIGIGLLVITAVIVINSVLWIFRKNKVLQ